MAMMQRYPTNEILIWLDAYVHARHINKSIALRTISRQ